jgi:hypothetical protein
MPALTPNTGGPVATLAATLAATLIVRNEARCIVRCLESVRPWVDRIVLVDTGSTDDTVALARACGAEVHHFAWTDDFSAARNYALDCADADWNLVLDADEWIESGGDTLQSWRDGPPRLGTVCVHSADDAAGAGVAGGAAEATQRSWITRLLPRGVRYERRIHEQVVSALPRVRLDLHLGHDGYLAAQMAGKIDRNRPLLLRDLQDRADDPYIHFQLGKDAEIRHDHAEAAAHYAAALARTPDGANWRHELVVRLLHCLGRSGDAAAGLALAETEMPAWVDSPDFFFVVGNLALDRAMADPARAIGDWLPLAQSAWERCLEIGERPELEGSVQGRGSHLARHNLGILRSQLAALGR